jgi:lysophospholipase L1-like esterase
MKPLDVINRGFGGATIANVNRFAARVVIPYRPRAVVLYAGDNDLYIWRKSPEAVLEDFKRFVKLVHTEFPETWIYYISMKPAPKGNWEVCRKANGMIEAYTHTEERVQFIDVSSAMLDAQGHLRPGFYGADPMHMNTSGYVLWTSIIKPVLMNRFADASHAPGP